MHYGHSQDRRKPKTEREKQRVKVHVTDISWARVCVCFSPYPPVVQEAIVCDGGQAFEQCQWVVGGNIFSPSTQADHKKEK